MSVSRCGFVFSFKVCLDLCRGLVEKSKKCEITSLIMILIKSSRRNLYLDQEKVRP